jgi:sarcosine oxidase
MVAAQILLAMRAGAQTIESPAIAVRSRRHGLTIECSSAVTADQVILATGAYGGSLVGVDLAIQRRLRTIVLAELGLGREIPCFIDDAPEHPDLDGVYWVPPVLFPDGRTMLKIGGNSLPLITAESDADIDAWFQGGGSEAETIALKETVRSLLPDASIASWDHKPCVVTNTEPELPFIGFVDDRVIVAVGASGAGAKSSDELGRLAATLASSIGWNDPTLDSELFRPRFRT